MKYFHSFAVLVAILLMIAYQVDNFANDPGVGWHLQTGQLIFDTGQIPNSDPFLHSSIERSWIADQWAADLLLYILYQSGAWSFSYSFLFLIFLIALMYVAPSAITHHNHLNATAISLASLLAFKMASIHLIFRPVIFSLFFFSLLVYAIYRLKLKQLFLVLPCLFLLWANFHPSFLLGLFLIGIYIISAIVDLFINKNRTLSNIELNQWLILLLLCTIATFVNPYFHNLHESIIWLSQSDYFLSLNQEWRSLNFKSPEGKLYMLTMGIVFLGAILRPQFISGLRSFEFIAFLIFAFLAAHTVRFLPYYAILAVYPVALSVTNLCNFKPSQFKPSILLLVMFTAVILSPLRSVVFDGELGPSKNIYPYFAVDYLLRLEKPDRPKVVLSTPDWGGFITFQGQGKVKAVIDDRNTMLGESIYIEYFSSIENGNNWQAMARKHGADYALLPSNSMAARTLSDIDNKRLVFTEPDGRALLVKVVN